MHKILGRAGGLGAGRSVAAAARVHPAGFAVPSAVLVTAVVLFTLVTSIAIRVIPPGASGPGSAQAVSPSTGRLRHLVRPEQPVRLVRAGQPGVTGSPGQNARSLTSSPGQHARSLTGSLQRIGSPLLISAAAPPPAPGRAPGGIRNPSSSPSGGGPVSAVKQAVSSAATATAAIARSTQTIIAQVTQTIIAQVQTGGSGVPPGLPQLPVQSTSTGQSAGAPAALTQFVRSVEVPVSVLSSGSYGGSVNRTPSSAATGIAANAASTQPGMPQVHGGWSQGGGGQGDRPQPAAQNSPMTQTGDAQASPARSAPSGNVPVSPGSPGPDGGPVTQAPPAAGTATAAAGIQP